MEVIYLKTEVVRQFIENRSKEDKGANAPCRDVEGLSSLLEEIKDDKLYPDLAAKLAHLVIMFCRNHYFVDFNKQAAIEVGVLFLYVNGFKSLWERFLQVMPDYISFIVKGVIGEKLLCDMMSSMLDGDEDFSEFLKLRILMAIDKQLPMDELGLHFEKGIFSQDGTHIGIGENTYPIIRLVLRENVTEYGQKTCFSMYYVSTDESNEYIGEVKIMHADGDTFNNMEETFVELGDKFCSLGLDNMYYLNLLHMFGIRQASNILQALRDAGTNESVYEQFSSHPIFVNSLYNDLSSQKARKEASLLMDGREMDEAFSFTYRYVPIYNENAYVDWRLDIDYDCLPFKRTYAIIGENGVGKTQMMAHLMHDLVEVECPNLNRKPLFGSVLSICSSHYDEYMKQLEKIKKPRIPVNVCTVVQDEHTTKRQYDAIAQIIKRGKYYTGKEMLSLREHYIDLLCIQLGADVAQDLIIEKDKIGEYIVNDEKLNSLVEKMSTGELQIFELVTYVCAHVHLKTLVLIDEPEVHLHPRFVTLFFATLSNLLYRFESYAIISTHSPVVVRECVNQNVYIMSKAGNIPSLGKVRFPTFGEDLSVLYQNIFEFDERCSYFYGVVRNMASTEGMSYKRVVEFLEAEKIKLGLNSRDVIRDCFEEISNK